MLTDDLDLARLRALAAAVRFGSFDAAARELHVTPSALSQRIKALESAAGRVLLVRSRPVVATEAGSGLLRLARQIELLTEDAVRALDGGAREGRGPVTVPMAVNADSLATWVLPALATVPEVVVELHREDQEHTTAFLRDGTVLAAVTAEAEAVLGCTVAPLGVMRYRAMAAPAFADRWFPSGDLAALAEAPGAIPARRVTDTLKRGEAGRIGGTVPREGLWRAQTPQAFRFPVLLAAHRAGITTVIIPQRNEPDLDDVPSDVLAQLDVRPVSNVREVLDLALTPATAPVARAA